MAKALKEMLFNEYDAAVGDRDSLLFVHSQNITAEATRELRNRLAEVKVRMLVVKNSVFGKVLEKRGIKGADRVPAGPIAVLYGEGDGGAMRAAKIVDAWKGEKRGAATAVLGGVLEGEVADAATAETFKDLPTREEMLSILLGQITSLGAKLASQITAMGGAVASQIKERGEGKGNPPPAAE